MIPLEEIGTDRRRFDGLEERFGLYYDQTWFAREKSGWLADGYQAIATDGYQAPPLEGIWATAPYFHNGSAPTVDWQAGVVGGRRRVPTHGTARRTPARRGDSPGRGAAYLALAAVMQPPSRSVFSFSHTARIIAR